MLRILFLAQLLLASATGAAQCLQAAEVRELQARLERYLVKVDIQDFGDDGSGFLLNSNRGVEIVTAHHVVVDDGGKEITSCQEPEEAPADPYKLLVAKVQFHSSQPQSRRTTPFATRSEHFGYPLDLVKHPLPAKGFQGLEATDRPLFLGEEVLIAGFPMLRDRQFTVHRCYFRGYAEGLYDPAPSSLELFCPDIDYDIAAMSGGLALSLCTGRAVGAISYQNFHRLCPAQGESKGVFVTPLHKTADGQIGFGSPKVPSRFAGFRGIL